MTSPEVQRYQVAIDRIHSNTGQTLIEITEDKLRLVLVQHLGVVESKRRWHVPFSILIALVSVSLTSDFRDVWGIGKATWQALFMFATVASIVWLVVTLRFAFEQATLDSLVQRVKNISQDDG